ncbi:MAG: MFS transporter, partial [Bacteroidetes bacterium]|nr:MFS transporter [Bacteroidota bacterium]
MAFFFFNAGVQTVIYMATNFGTKEIGAAPDLLIVAIMVIQVFGIVGAIGFSRLSGKFGNIKTLMVIMSIYIALCIWVYFIYGQNVFIIAAGCVGFVMGGSQALSRSTYSKMLPETEDHATFFS